jgi:hypothetical protein
MLVTPKSTDYMDSITLFTVLSLDKHSFPRESAGFIFLTGNPIIDFP